MTSELPGKNKPNYGIDAPNVVRNLIICGAIGFILWLSTVFNLWSGNVVIRPGASVELDFPMGIIGIIWAIGFTSTAIWMVWSSKIGKIKQREKLLQNFSWKGNEMVLDVGCGRGLMLIGAAKRLSTGKAVGIDIWHTEDLSGNKMEATLENCRIENVEERTEIKTADMRQLPFADAIFDIVLSCTAIHNLHNASDRNKAISEIARVLKPGGQALIDDIRFHNEYASNFTANGCKDVKRVSSPIVDFLATLITFGSLRPATIMVKKGI
jgi:SAM-dependent methyltransferase